jgi:5-methylcytosine-specific restriction endonuclease McrA
VALGIGLHVALDKRHVARMNQARSAALARDGYSCQACGTAGSRVIAHVRWQPRLLPSYRAQNLISLCDPCHEAAHARVKGVVSWT